jgi:hypothetical protein
MLTTVFSIFGVTPCAPSDTPNLQNSYNSYTRALTREPPTLSSAE